MGERQCVEILKALHRGAEILIMDEPTSVLTPQESEELFRNIQRMASEGKSVIFITHKLKEVITVSDNITVMRQGKVTGRVKSRDTNETQLANLMIGRPVILRIEKPEIERMDRVLRLQDIKAIDDHGLVAVNGVSLDVHQREIVGVAGVQGNGQKELVEVITGLRSSIGGRIFIGDEEISSLSIRSRRKKGISHIPEDRLSMGVCSASTLEENLILNSYFAKPFSKFSILNWREISNYAISRIQDFSIAAPSSKVTISTLSGGNIQRTILAREMVEGLHLLIANQPTQGLDIGAIEYVRSQIIEMRNKGAAVLVVSSDLDEILSLSDRIVVMYEGEIAGEFDATLVNDEQLGLAMGGTRFD
jgi:simple sugar transport system ATP-binding protein